MGVRPSKTASAVLGQKGGKEKVRDLKNWKREGERGKGDSSKTAD